MSETAVSLSGVGVTLGQYEVLKNVTARVPAKCQTIIIGPNGSGKSTLVLSLLGLVPYTGKIIFSQEGPRIGYVPQRLDFDRHLPLTVSEYLSLAHTRRPLWLGCPARLKERIKVHLDQVKAGHLLARPLGALSGGEMQRVLLASALMTRPEILILDEPATGVDVYGEQLLCELLEGFKADLTVIMVSHDLSTARAHGDWIICLNRRVIAEGPPDDIIRPSILAATYGLHQGLIFGEDSCGHVHHHQSLAESA